MVKSKGLFFIHIFPLERMVGMNERQVFPKCGKRFCTNKTISHCHNVINVYRASLKPSSAEILSLRAPVCLRGS